VENAVVGDEYILRSFANINRIAIAAGKIIEDVVANNAVYYTVIIDAVGIRCIVAGKDIALYEGRAIFDIDIV
jgi:hypothetical protein